MRICTKNLPKSEAFALASQVDIREGQVVSKTIAQNDALSVTLFAFDQGEELSTHTARGDAFVTVLEGRGRFTVDGVAHSLSVGESIVMPVDIPHAVYAEEPFKMLLVVIYPYEVPERDRPIQIK